MAYRFAVRFGRSTDVTKRLDDRLGGEHLPLVGDRERRPLVEDDLNLRSFVCRCDLAPGIGSVLQELNDEAAVVLAAELTLGVRERSQLSNVLRSREAASLEDFLGYRS